MTDEEWTKLNSLSASEMIDLVASRRAAGELIEPDDVNAWLGPASVFDSNMREAFDPEQMRLKARAAIAIYDLLFDSAKDSHSNFDVSAMRIRVFLIEKLGVIRSDDLQDPDLLAKWLLGSTRHSPQQAKDEAERFWPRVREKGMTPEDINILSSSRALRQRITTIMLLTDAGIKVGDEQVGAWLDVHSSLL